MNYIIKKINFTFLLTSLYGIINAQTVVVEVQPNIAQQIQPATPQTQPLPQADPIVPSVADQLEQSSKPLPKSPLPKPNLKSKAPVIKRPLTPEQIRQQENKLESEALKKEQNIRAEQVRLINKVEKEGVQVRIKDIARFRGIRMNQLQGYGLVTGLEGTGDTQNSPFTANLLANTLQDFGTSIKASLIQTKNIALVAITAELPTSASPGNQIDVTVHSMGDAKSLQGGYLLQSRLFAAHDKTSAMAVAQGPLSIGGFNVGSGGTSTQKNHVNVGRIPGGAIVEKGVATQFLFDNNTLYLELFEADLTTSQRIASSIKKSLPGYNAVPIDGGTVKVNVPAKVASVEATSKIEAIKVFADIAAVIVINERTGTIVIGGNVRLGPAVIAHGSLQISVQKDLVVSQPGPLSGKNAKTVVGSETTAESSEQLAKVGIIAPTASVNDLAKILQTLRLAPRDIIAILQALKEQGALKARIKVQ